MPSQAAKSKVFSPLDALHAQQRQSPHASLSFEGQPAPYAVLDRGRMDDDPLRQPLSVGLEDE